MQMSGISETWKDLLEEDPCIDTETEATKDETDSLKLSNKKKKIIYEISLHRQRASGGREFLDSHQYWISIDLECGKWM